MHSDFFCDLKRCSLPWISMLRAHGTRLWMMCVLKWNHTFSTTDRAAWFFVFLVEFYELVRGAPFQHRGQRRRECAAPSCAYALQLCYSQNVLQVHNADHPHCNNLHAPPPILSSLIREQKHAAHESSSLRSMKRKRVWMPPRRRHRASSAALNRERKRGEKTTQAAQS